MSLKPSEIVTHLKKHLPRFTDLFTESLNVTAAAISSGNILTLTSVGHGKSPGQYVVISAGTVRNLITASTLIYPSVRFTTAYDHDLTQPSLPNDDWYLNMGGFGNNWDGQHEIVDVPNRRNFEILFPTGAIISGGGIGFPLTFPITFVGYSPVISGTEYLSEPIPKGAYPIATTPDLDTISIDLSAARTLPEGTVDDIKVVSGFRIAAAADINRATDIYSKQATGAAYLFVIMTDMDVSKDRNILNDSIAELTRKDLLFLRLLQSFSTTVFLPTTEDLSGIDAQELAYDEVFTALLKTLYGYSIDGSMYKAVSAPAGMGPGEYNSAYYTHVYDWQLPYIINFEDAMPHDTDVAFRNIDYSHIINGDDTDDVTIDGIDLDEEPIIPT